jgi:hypothetical protein
MVIRKEQSFIRINYMALPRLHLMMATLIGGNTRMATRKVMQHISILVEADTSVSGCRVTSTGMEYSDGQMERFIKDNSNKIKEMVMDITGGLMAMSIMDSTRMIRSTEKESS